MNHDIFVLIPGITGSVLQKDGKDVFALSAGAGFRALFSGGASLRDLMLSDDPWEVPDLGDGVTAPRLVDDAHLVPGLWKIDGYTKVGAYLRRRFGLTTGQDYFDFPYDWRRDNRVAAHRLAHASRGWLEAHRATHPDARLVLVAHSMGGLIARYFLEVLDGWRDVRWLVTFGTPYRGSMNAVDFVGNGLRKLSGLVDLTDLMCSFTSVQQLLPIYPCIDVDGQMSRLTEMPHVLPRLDPAAIHEARQFHREIEEAVTRNQQLPDYGVQGYTLRPVIGIDQPTYQSAVWDAQDRRLDMLRSHGGKDMGGDGTVPRVSASPIEWDHDDAGMFSRDKHASLQNADTVHTQLHGWMTRQDLSDFKAHVPVTVTVHCEDVHEFGQPVAVRLEPSSATTGVEISLTWIGGPEPPRQPTTEITLPFVEGSQEIEFPATVPGCYRLHVDGDAIEPVTDLVVVSPR